MSEPTRDEAGQTSRSLAIDALVRIEQGGAYANIMLPTMLSRSSLRPEDRRFVTELVYGTTRMKRACDHLVDRFVIGETDPRVRAGLRIGAYQLHYLKTPPHAAVGETVAATGGRGRSVVNAVLRRLADTGTDIEFPSSAVELSYPDWIVDRMVADLGQERALAALAAMNRPATTVERDDGYVQDPASQAVVAAVGAEAGHLVVDLCAAPGGKATGLAATGALVVAADRRRSRVRLVEQNLDRLGIDLPVIIADGRHPPIKTGTVDRVLVDAPCSGFGSFRRRPDARWRIEPEAPSRLQELQIDLVRAGAELVKPGGELIYSVCTLTAEEGPKVAEAISTDGRFELVAADRTPPWFEMTEGVSALLPEKSDGMMLFRLRHSGTV